MLSDIKKEYIIQYRNADADDTHNACSNHDQYHRARIQPRTGSHDRSTTNRPGVRGLHNDDSQWWQKNENVGKSSRRHRHTGHYHCNNPSVDYGTKDRREREHDRTR